MGFLFGGDTNLTPEQVARKREIADALAQKALQTPKNLGEGLSAIGNAILYRKLSGEAAKAEAAGQAAANDRFGAIFGALERGGQQAMPEAPAPQSPDAVQTALLPPVERAPEPQYRPRMPQGGNMAGVVPPDGGPALGSLTVEQPGQGDVMPSAPYQPPMQVAQAGGGMPSQQQPMSQAQAGGPSISAIWGVMSDPYATPQQKQVAGMMFKQRFEQMDPKYQQEMRKLAQDIENGKPEAQIELKRRLFEMEDNRPGAQLSRDIDRQRLDEMRNKPPEVRTVKQADGSETAVQWDAENKRWVPINAPQGGGDVRVRGSLKESEQKLTLFSSLQKETQPVLLDLERNFNPGNLPDAFARGVLLGNFYQSQEGQMYDAAATQWAEGALRIATGAAATPPEMERTKKSYFAQPGDTPQTIAFKAQMREMYQRSIERGLGYKDVEGALPLPSEFAAQFSAGKSDAAPTGAPAIGTVENGFEYLGGDPSKQESWRPVQ